MFLYLFETVYTPYYFENMRGLKLDLEIVMQLLRQGQRHVFDFLDGNHYQLDHYLMNWLVCLFMSLNISFTRKFEILEYIIMEKKKGMFRIIQFLFAQRKAELLNCQSINEIEESLRDFYTELEDDFLFALLSRVGVDADVINTIGSQYSHDFDPDQYTLTDGKTDIKDCFRQGYFESQGEIPGIRIACASQNYPPLIARAQVDMSTETIHKRYKNYLFPI